jgi:murein DD-endopeptidase MepM/ murein hydrolase activator NlpD
MRQLAAVALLARVVTALFAAPGIWAWPLGADPGHPPTVLRPFHPGAHRWDRAHRGVDLADPAGDRQVAAAGPGTVLVAGPVFGRGVVVIGHGSLRTSYEPVVPAVAVGAAVARGQRIGTLEPGHCPRAACLHWGLLAGRGHGIRYYDPMILFGPGRVRLEPADTR